MTLDQFSQAVLDFVRTHQSWAPFVAAGLAFGESLVFVSLLFTGTGNLVANCARGGA